MSRSKLAEDRGIRILYAALPKMGKTGSIAALANIGMTIRYLNFDGNPDPVKNFCKDAAARKRIQIVDCVDKMRIIGDQARTGARVLIKTDGIPKGYEAALDALVRWPVDGSDPKKWDDSNVLVPDSLTYMARSILARLKNVGSTEDKRVSWTEYDMVQSEIDRFLVLCKLYLKCPLIAITHLQLMGPDLDVGDVEDDELREALLREKLRGAEKVPWQLAPMTLGRAQSTRLAGHFTGTLYAKYVDGRGRLIFTEPEDGFAAGVPVPDLKRDYPIATGLGDIMKAWQKLQA